MSTSTTENEQRKEDEENDHMEGNARQAWIPNQTQNDLNRYRKVGDGDEKVANGNAIRHVGKRKELI